VPKSLEIKQYLVKANLASHLLALHEANVEQVFSLSGALADPNLTPEHLTWSVFLAIPRYSRSGGIR